MVRTREGRLRLGWRILVFLALSVALVTVALMLTPSGIVGQGAATLAAGVGAGWILLAMEGRSPRALGFYPGRAAVRESAAGWLLGVVVAGASVLAMAVAGGVAWQGDDGTVVRWLESGLRALGLFALPAAAEEALFRGYPLQALAESLGRGVALVVTSVGFGLLHLANPNLNPLAMANLVAAGLLLGAVYLRTGSLWWATGAHLGWNWTLGFLADVPVSGLELVDAPLLEGVARGPAWLGGGGFGPEGSVVTLCVGLAAAALVWWGPWLRPSAEARAAEPLMPLPAPPESAKTRTS